MQKTAFHVLRKKKFFSSTLIKGILFIIFQSMDTVAMTTVGAKMKSVEMQQTCQKCIF